MRTLDSDKKEIEKSYYVKMLETFSSQMTIALDGEMQAWVDAIDSLEV